MKNSDWIWKGVIIWFCLIYHFHVAEPTERNETSEPVNEPEDEYIYYEAWPRKVVVQVVVRPGKPAQLSATVEPTDGNNPLESPKPPTPSPPPNVKPPNSPELPQPLPQIPGCGRKESLKKIRTYVIGGHDAEEHWPWMVAIHVSRNGYQARFTCGGSLITNRHVLTAAHCFDTRKRNRDTYSVLLGTSNLTSLSRGARVIPRSVSSSGEFIDVLNIRIHEQYVPGVHYNDIALLTLESKAPLSELIYPVCLPSPDDFMAVTSYVNVTVTGWGHTTFGGSESKFLQEAELKIIPFRSCQLSFEEFRSQGLSQGITTDMMCAGFPRGGFDACKGDSGGPLVMNNEGRWMQVGIVAFGVRCGEENFPGVYTKVSAYMRWITRILSEYQYII